MQGIKNLTQGPINRQLFNLAMPIMATSFIQMAYSLTDMAWVGRLGSEAVAAVGSVGILTWMSGSISLLNKVGSEVSVGQSIGAQNYEDARCFASHNITIALVISLCWGGLLFLFARPIIGIYELEAHITENAIAYLRIISTGLPFIFLSAAFTGIYNAAGRSKIPFYISGTGLLLNIILDPLFIFGFGLGTNGAAYATWISQAAVFGIFIYQLRCRDALLERFPFFTRLKKKYTHRILKLGLPGSYSQYSVCFRQHVPLPYCIRTRRAHRTDDFYDRRTNRSHYLEYIAGILHSPECFYRPKLCSRTNGPRNKVMAYDFVDDFGFRYPLYLTIRLFRERSICTFCPRAGCL